MDFRALLGQDLFHFDIIQFNFNIIQSHLQLAKILGFQFHFINILHGIDEFFGNVPSSSLTSLIGCRVLCFQLL